MLEYQLGEDSDQWDGLCDCCRRQSREDNDRGDLRGWRAVTNKGVGGMVSKDGGISEALKISRRRGAERKVPMADRYLRDERRMLRKTV